MTLSVKVADILNQQKSLQRSISANFVEDVYRNVMGRYIMIGVSFNFGKMNATQANKAQRALWEMGISFFCSFNNKPYICIANDIKTQKTYDYQNFQSNR